MFEFLAAVFNKAIWAVATVMMVVGIGSSSVVIEPVEDASSTPVVVAEAEADKEIKKTAQVSDVFADPEPVAVPTPTPTPTPTPIPTSTPAPTPQFFTLPSGVVVDASGNSVNSEPATADESALPVGWSQLPSGKYMNTAMPGVLYDVPPQSTAEIIQMGQMILPTGWTQMMSGIFKGPDGKLYNTLPSDVEVHYIPINKPTAPELPAGWTIMMSGAFKDSEGHIHFSLP